MDELRYMKQLVREYFDLINHSFEDSGDMRVAFKRVDEVESELKELSGYSTDE